MLDQGCRAVIDLVGTHSSLLSEVLLRGLRGFGAGSAMSGVFIFTARLALSGLACAVSDALGAGVFLGFDARATEGTSATAGATMRSFTEASAAARSSALTFANAAVAGPIGAAATIASGAGAPDEMAAEVFAGGVGFNGSHFSKRSAASRTASSPRLLGEVAFFTSRAMSLTPVSFAAASIARWKSRDMDLALAVNRPSVRNISGKSLGPITIRATTPMIKSSDQPISNISGAPLHGRKVWRSPTETGLGPRNQALSLSFGVTSRSGSVAAFSIS